MLIEAKPFLLITRGLKIGAALQSPLFSHTSSTLFCLPELSVLKRDRSGPARPASAAPPPPLLPELSDLISRAALITQQMGTERSVTKTKTNPRLDYGSCGVRVRVRTLLTVSPETDCSPLVGARARRRFRFTPVCPSALCARDPCVPHVFISH